MTHLGLLGPHLRPETHSKYPCLAAFPIAWLLMVKITLRQPQFIPVLTCPLKFISTLPRYPDSHIWGHLGPPQRPETTLITPNTVAFYMAWLWMVKLMLWLTWFIPTPTLPLKSVSPTPGGLNHTSGAIYVPIIVWKQPKILPTEMNFPKHYSAW